MMKQGRLYLFPCVLALLLSACGFHLRGSHATRVDLPPVYLQGDTSAFHELFIELRRALEGAGAQVVDSKGAAQRVLTVLDEDSERRVLSVGSTGKVKEYELHYTVTFSVEDAQGASVLSPQTVSLLRNYVFDETAVMAKDTEAAALLIDMRREATQQILRRLQVLSRGGS